MAEAKSLLGKNLEDISKVDGIPYANIKSWNNLLFSHEPGWSDIFTYTTNASATTVTAWIGQSISTDVTVPNTIETLPVYVNTNSTFRNDKNVTTVNIESDSVWFEGATKNTMTNAFSGCNVLTSVNAIPANVTSMASTFSSCSSLVDAPAIPANVTNMSHTFSSCRSLVNAPTIPANVTNMHSTFQSCYRLVNAPVIPANVTNMYATFESCTRLVNAPVIPANVTTMCSTFHVCSNLVNAPAIPANVTSMYATFSSCSKLVNAPEIGQNVVNHHSTFKSCTNLAGNITLINTSVTEVNMTDMFYGCNASIPKTLRCPTGSLTYNSAINVVDGKNGVTVVAY
jgi:hypothetical protein